jgi:Flp pilus assembly protein TadG
MRKIDFRRPGALARGLSDNRGNVAIVVALAMVPVSVASLGAIDLAHATSAKSQLQDALDAAALGAAHSNATTDAELQTVGARYLSQNLSLSSDYTLASSSFTFGEGGKVLASATMNVTPIVAGLVTSGVMHVGAQAEVVRAAMKLEIAMVLDNTGSMNEGWPSKLSNLKTAATNFITTMQKAAEQSSESDAIKIALVPFSNTVRVDENAYLNASWIDQAGASPINDLIFTTANGTHHANRLDLFRTLGTSWGGCVETRQAPYDVQDTPPTSGATLYTPYFAVDEPDERTDGYRNNYSNDYLPDGTTDNNWRVRQGSISKYKRTTKLNGNRGPNKGCNLKRIQRLTTSYDSLKDQIRNLVADGNTNIPIGMAWGWNVLSPYGPFGDGASYGTTKLKKVVVLMTDGENTMSYIDTPNDSDYSGAGYIWEGRILKASGQPLQVGDDNAARTDALDSRLSKICANMQAKGIEIYTVRVEVRSGSSSVLKGCATDEKHYFDVDDSSNLDSVFQTIAGQIAALHLSR